MSSSKELTKPALEGELQLSITEANIVELMIEHKGDLRKVSREETVTMNAIALRKKVSGSKAIREAYKEGITLELQYGGLDIGTRLAKFCELQDKAFGDEELGIPPDVGACIAISKHISELLVESKKMNMSKEAVKNLTSKEKVVDILQAFLES